MSNQKLRTNQKPLYLQAQDLLLARIMDGTYNPGEKLVPEDELAASLGISRTTIRAALGNLETMGYINRIHGDGTYVNETEIQIVSPLDVLEPWHPKLTSKAGLSSKLSGLSIERVCAKEEIASHLKLSPETMVVEVARIVEIDDQPVAYLIDYIPETIATVEEIRLGFKDSVIDYFDGHDGRPLISWTQSTIFADRADDVLIHLFNVKPDCFLLRIDGGFYDQDRKLINWSRNHVIPDYFRFTTGWQPVSITNR